MWEDKLLAANWHWLSERRDQLAAAFSSSARVAMAGLDRNLCIIGFWANSIKQFLSVLKEKLVGLASGH